MRWLWPIPVGMFVVYPYLKRFTWLCHLWLGASLGLAPVGAWVAAHRVSCRGRRGRSAPPSCLWVAGFDLFYALLDLEHDSQVGLHVVGDALRRARRVRGRGARCTRRRSCSSPRPGSGLASASRTALGLARRRPRSSVYEHRSCGPGDLRRLDAAFFTVNGVHQHRRFLAFVAARDDDVIAAARLGKRYGTQRGAPQCRPRARRAAATLLVTGPNGSGKTTLLRLLAGLAAPTAGSSTVDLDRRQLGYLGHEPLVYRDLTRRSRTSSFTARSTASPEPAERIGTLLERFGLGRPVTARARPSRAG